MNTQPQAQLKVQLKACYPWFDTFLGQMLSRMDAQKCHHGMLLLGPEGLGKADLAVQLAQALLCKTPGQRGCGQCQACLLFAAGSHPDFHQVQSEKQIGVDDIRQAIEKLQGTAQLSGAKALIIHQADSMTESAANALLKTLEEPTRQTYLILTSAKPHRLLPTILSRCEKLLLPQPDKADCGRWLASEQIVAEPALLEMYYASPLILRQMANAEAGLGYQDFITALDGLRQGSTSAVQVAGHWQEQAARFVHWLQHWLLSQSKPPGPQFNQWWPLYQASLVASKQLTHPGINKALLLSGLLSQLAGISSRSV
ncbi:DNA polymerase III subunit delta' [Aliiglaciecola sp. CAU 1673]|uniref:DNA polymerase III subunit delta' n=1 Tax=Aliiglaciecola sp. CAU 1673 TaxID=3032595 RepID=UPI0023DB59A0|nr:DNA polymerase III subunit delta' [Aliiglaciecola sp. CAU 1673]MDF2177634.1 DNA polymerase III subunit delta' [Aliiglaciecola sp. CAU 1673]